VILPARNRKNLEDIPESARQKLEFVWAERVEDVLPVAVSDQSPRPQRTAQLLHA
jgi:ATP-dependent Lon protease